ncbi:hypothetical protein L7F22_029072 [Adiantum nelumboides]|nr:hypothetical protein [Adiantum nelumboides]
MRILRPLPFPGGDRPGTTVELACRLAREAWGHGFATRAARLALADLAGALQDPERRGLTAVGNDRSRAVMERLGLRPAGTFPHPAVPEGRCACTCSTGWTARTGRKRHERGDPDQRRRRRGLGHGAGQRRRRAGHPVTLWLRDAQAAAALQAQRENPRYLPGVPLHPAIRATADADALAGARATLVVRQFHERGGRAGPAPGVPVAVLSGPSFAADVARGLPTAVTLAAVDAGLAAGLSALLSGPSFRVYHTDDVRGVEIGGAGKNVLAIASGIVAGRGLGESARAALIARAFAELMRFARAYGGRPETLMGLSGLGDLVLTASSPQSRNFAFGERLGAGASRPRPRAASSPRGRSPPRPSRASPPRRVSRCPVAEAVAAIVAARPASTT